MSETDLKIVFMGSSNFAVPALDLIFRAGYRILYVVTQPDRIRGRGNKVLPTPVGAYALENGLKMLKPENLREDEHFLKTLTEAGPDLIVVAAYGKILPKSLLELPPLGCVNIHASLLPEYRGAAPVRRAILDGKQKTGVTLMYASERLDSGDTIAYATTDVSGMNAGELAGTLAQIGAELLLDKLPAIADKTAPRLPQDESKAVYTEKITKADEKLDLLETAEVCVRRVRAMSPAPGAYILRGGDRMVITEARTVSPESIGVPIEKYEAAAPGTVLAVSEKGISVRTGEGLLQIEALKIPGKKAMPVREYLKGNAFDITEPLE